MLRLGIMAAAMGLLSGPALAQAVLQSRLLTAEAANAMVMGALAQCRKDGYKVSAAVVDRGGNLLAFIRDPTAGPHTAESSRRKAFTAATFGMTSAAFRDADRRSRLPRGLEGPYRRFCSRRWCADQNRQRRVGWDRRRWCAGRREG